MQFAWKPTYSLQKMTMLPTSESIWIASKTPGGFPQFLYLRMKSIACQIGNERVNLITAQLVGILMHGVAFAKRKIEGPQLCL